MERFFQLIDGFRSWYLAAEQWWLRASGALKILLFAASLILLFAGAAYLEKAPESATLFCVILLLVLYFVGNIGALHSCRRLLIVWLLNCTLVALFANVVIPIQTNSLTGPILEYCFFVFCYTLAWVMTAAAVDADVAKMAGSIINTVTTIALIVFNVLILWGMQNLDAAFLSGKVWSWLQYYSNLILLPFVVAGYLASLLAEMRSYWSRKRERIEDAQESEMQK